MYSCLCQPAARLQDFNVAPVPAQVGEEEVPVPPQYKPQPLYDFRNAPDETRGFKVGVTKYGKQGTKRKLEEYAEQVGSRKT